MTISVLLVAVPIIKTFGDHSMAIPVEDFGKRGEQQRIIVDHKKKSDPSPCDDHCLDVRLETFQCIFWSACDQNEGAQGTIPWALYVTSQRDVST
jgi:hypothetical protein